MNRTLIEIKVLQANDVEQETITFLSMWSTVGELLALFRDDPRCGRGTLSNKDDVLLPVNCILSAAVQPYRFRKHSALQTHAPPPGPVAVEEWRTSAKTKHEGELGKPLLSIFDS